MDGSGFFIAFPQTAIDAQVYILRLSLERYLGIKCDFRPHDDSRTVISKDGRSIYIENNLFLIDQRRWFTEDSSPTEPLQRMPLEKWGLDETLGEKDLPIIFSCPSGQVVLDDASLNSIRIGFDLFGSMFYMLTRYEEVARPSSDSHNRFSAKASLAFREGFLLRPIVNEYLELLWRCFERLWPEITRKPRQFRILPSHDVDSAYMYPSIGVRQFGRILAGDLLKRRSIPLAIERARRWSRSRRPTADPLDPFNTFDFLMGVSEQFDLRSSFYFIPKQDARNANYSLKDASIRLLLQNISARGHEIGLHGSYRSFDAVGRPLSEVREIKNTCVDLGIALEAVGGRQHYLCWDQLTTPLALDLAGLSYDSTLGYADHVGFRCGVCFEYPLYDLVNHRELRVMERPLVLMDCSLIDDVYMGLGFTSQALSIAARLKEKCQRYSGDYTVLWHNSFHLESSAAKDFYIQLLAK